MKTGFLGQPYVSRSPILASQTAINIFATLMETEGAEVGGFLGAQGLQGVFQGAGEVRGLWVTPDELPGSYHLWAVIGNQVWRFNKDYQGILAGTLPNSGGIVSMVDNGTQIAIAHIDGWHYSVLLDPALTPVANSPGGSILTYLDEYVIYSANTGGQFGITALADLSSIDPTDVATAEGWPDDCVACLADHEEVVLFGTETIEVWDDTGAPLFPFQRIPGGFVEQGLAAPRSPAKLDNSVFWVGRDRNGQGVIFRSNGYIPQRISTHAIEFAIKGTIEDAIGFAFQEEGHLFYFLTFPTLNQSWAYDVSTKMWHQRAYQDPATGKLGRHRANCFAHFYGDNLVGDYANGKIYRMNLGLTTDDGDPIYRERAWELPELEMDLEHKKFRADLLEVTAITGDGNPVNTDGTWTADSDTVTADSSSARADSSSADSGTIQGDWTVDSAAITMDSTQMLADSTILTPAYAAPLLWLQTSRDSGQTWSYSRFRPLGKIGQRKARARWRRLGSGRDWVFRIATNMTQRVSWGDAYIRGAELSQ